MTTENIRILIVDDSALYRLAVRNVLSKIQGCEVVGHAEGGVQALQKISELKPDLVTLDIEMPDLNGIQVLRELKARGNSAKVIVLSKHTPAGAQITMDALMEGAFDVICKSSLGSPAENQKYLHRELNQRIAAIQESQAPLPKTLAPTTASPGSNEIWSCSAVVIGSSTGGPEVLRQLFAELPASFPVPIIIVQHIPAMFSTSLANRLDGVSELRVVEATDGLAIEFGHAYVAPGGKHLKLALKNGQPKFETTEDPPENSCRPAVDYTLRSAIEILDGQVLAIILTGMGKDGLASCEILKQAGGRVFAQHASDCTVFGMPKAVIEAGLADRICTIRQLPELMLRELL